MRDKEHATSNFEKDIYVLLKEQIIIDGIDVSECEDVTGLKYCDGYGDWCYLYPNCYFKQNARKTQIIDEIEEVIKPYQEQNELDALSLPSAIKSILARKTQECEELKERATIAEDNFACEIQARLYHQDKWLKFSKEVDRYRKALEEIEEYFSHTDDPHMLSVDYEITAPTIIDIISKAKGEE